MKTNTALKPTQFTHEGAPAKRISPEQQLRRSLLSCFLWEKEFYEDGQEIAQRIIETADKCKPEFIAALCVEARTKFNLRHAPLFLLLNLIKRGGKLASETIYNTVNRADEMAELISMYWKDSRKPLSAQMKIGLAKAFHKFNEYQFAKNDHKDASVKLRDVIRLVHAKAPEGQEDLYKRISLGQLENPDTWESRMAGGENKKDVFTDLLTRKKLGYLALIRNLRGMNEAGVDHGLIKQAILTGDHSRVLPFRFISAAKLAPMFERELDTSMIAAMSEASKLAGKTVLLVDVSGSMDAAMSVKSDLHRVDAACGLAILLSGVCESLRVFTFSNSLVEVPARSGMALRDAIIRSQQHGGTQLGQAVATVNQLTFDRMIVISDEQAATKVPDPKGKAFMLNVASARNGVVYGPWVHIDGFSEACVGFIQQYESQAD